MIRKWSAAAALVGLIAVPVSRVWCELDCASDVADRVEMTAHCHEAVPALGDAAFKAQDECGAHAIEVGVFSLTGSYRTAGSPLVIAADVAAGDLAPVSSSRHGDHGRPYFSSSPPHSPGLSILRI